MNVHLKCVMGRALVLRMNQALRPARWITSVDHAGDLVCNDGFSSYPYAATVNKFVAGECDDANDVNTDACLNTCVLLTVAMDLLGKILKHVTTLIESETCNAIVHFLNAVT